MKFSSLYIRPGVFALVTFLALSACAAERDEGAADSALAGEAAAPTPQVEPAAPVAARTEPDRAPDALADASAAIDGAGWQYGSATVEGGNAPTASVAGTLDGGGRVELVFTNDPDWGTTAVIKGLPEPIECPEGCRAGISIDGGSQASVPASRPKVDGRTVLSLRKPRDLWRDLDGARELRLILPEGRTATFQVEGLDASRMRDGQE